MQSKLEKLNEEIIACRICPRLVEWREQVAREKREAYRDEDYWGKPVPGFGDPKARVLVVGLAPGAHGSNRTGRQFTGDASGNFLYPALFRAGFANQPHSSARSDGLTLHDMYISACARCVPPDNKPSREELNNCQPYLEREIEIIQPKVIVALGKIAFNRIIRIYSASVHGLSSTAKFSHSAAFDLRPFDLAHDKFLTLNPQRVTLLCSYHPSQQNTLTGKLTVNMFDEIWTKTKALLK